jgi:putative SOS response-associated peptidase YedK
MRQYPLFLPPFPSDPSQPMSVIVGRDEYHFWLDPAVQEVERLQPLLRPFPSDAMTAYAVSTVVNNPKNDVEECVKAV